jgi:hypothetical protein
MPEQASQTNTTSVTIELEGDRIYVEALGSFVDSLFKKRADLVANDHLDERAYIFNGVRRIEPHREEDARHHVQALKILLSILYLRETTCVKSWTDAEKWIRKKVTRIFENISGRVITGPFHGKHQTDFIEAIRYPTCIFHFDDEFFKAW